jgi:hypothetical protein
MGEYAYCGDRYVRIAADKVEPARLALIAAIDAGEIGGGPPMGLGRDDYELEWSPFVRGEEPRQERTRRLEDLTLADLLGGESWSIEVDPQTGDVVDLEWARAGEGKYHESAEDLLEAIAPFVDEGSFLDMECAEEHWRWRFTGGALKQYGGWVVYGDDAAVLLGDRAEGLYDALLALSDAIVGLGRGGRVVEKARVELEAARPLVERRRAARAAADAGVDHAEP